MCGRYVIRHDPEALGEFYKLEHSETPRDLQDIFKARYNVAPSQQVPVLRERSILRRDAASDREIVTVRWGLIPAWVKDASIGNRMINARFEGIESKPSFRAAFKSRRCIVPASSFYERKKDGPRKQPYLIKRRDDQR